MISRDFSRFWAGQAVSNLGSSFTLFALPLLIYVLTGSAVNLALTTVAEFLPFLLFGLVIGAWVDRVDRKRLMIRCDLGRALALASVPALDLTGALSVWWVYGVAFVTGTLWIAFSAAEFAAVKSLAPVDALVTANGRIQASYQAAQVVGPLVAGAAVGAGLPVAEVFAIDSCSFVVSAVTLSLVRAQFNEDSPTARQSVSRDVADGLRYVFRHPILRNVSILAALVNLLGVTVWTQLVLFAKKRLDATDTKVGVLFAAGSLGIAGLSLAAPLVRRYVSFSVATLGALMLYGALIVALALTRAYWIAVPLWAMTAGLPYSFSVHTLALRQQIVPDHMLGRVMTIAQVSAWSMNPLGALVGGWAIAATGSPAGVYGALGAAIFASATVFWFTALGRVDEATVGTPAASTGGRTRALRFTRKRIRLTGGFRG
jgi:transmembrane secretion effector